MGPVENDNSERVPRSRRRPLLVGALALALIASSGVVALAQDLRGQVDQKRAKLDKAKDREGVLTTEISAYSERIEKLTGQVAALRNREARVQQELDQAEERLRTEQRNLRILRERLARSTRILRERLIAIYKDDAPDALTVVLEANGFDAVLERYEYLDRIESQDSDIVTRVRDLRNDTRETVERVKAARDAIAAKKRELERTRINLQNREAELSRARGQSRKALGGVRGNIQRLEGDIEDLEDEIQAELAAAAAAAAEANSPEAPGSVPAGPVRGGSGDMIWPVNGPVTSPFGQRWGRLHAGIDISAPSGTPIRAVKDGVIALAAPYGGYGNYTCINHGGGLSSCYAHLSSFAITSGSVSQGDVIGNVGCTGSCFGDHLHFEIRVGGTPTDPMGYL
jgi:murein DD-endopeptidase MepM/ murein hydrolase activator NlpD